MLSNNYLRALPYELGKLFQLQVFRIFIQGCIFLINHLELIYFLR